MQEEHGLVSFGVPFEDSVTQLVGDDLTRKRFHVGAQYRRKQEVLPADSRGCVMRGGGSAAAVRARLALGAGNCCERMLS